jgi:hypothetical protein
MSAPAPAAEPYDVADVLQRSRRLLGAHGESRIDAHGARDRRRAARHEPVIRSDARRRSPRSRRAPSSFREFDFCT